MTITALPRRSLVDQALGQLRATVESGEWPVGERIPNETVLAGRLGVGRNTVREAVRVLVHAGLLETRQGDGTYVRARLDPAEALRRIERAELFEQLETRIALESEAARLAALRWQPEDLRALREALVARAAAGNDLAQRIHHDHRFHEAIAQAAHNRALLALYRYFSSAVARTIEHTERNAELPEPSQADHEKLLDAIELRDADAAARLARAMLAPSLGVLGQPS